MAVEGTTDTVVARRSRRRSVRDALVPQAGTTAKVGPGYAVSLIDYTSRHWRPEIAATRSESLARLRDFLRRCASSPDVHG